MMVPLVLLAGVLAVAVTMALLALRRAPEGYEDESGFHAAPCTPRKVLPGAPPRVAVEVNSFAGAAGGDPVV